MSGKSYTMKEMKSIVDYLVEHRAYGEIKGRKIWTDMASSNITTRSWQSLKETFLKRILPDVHNPYYKLSIHQISSFHQGYDVQARLNNKLEIQSTNPDPDGHGDSKAVKEKSNNSESLNQVKSAGEDPKQSTIRSSTETLVLENCYETAEDIARDLQSPVEMQENVQNTQKKTLRELITYSEPLTPMLQGVLDDFMTDEDVDEPKMQIVEQEPEEFTKSCDGSEELKTIEISDSEENDTSKSKNDKPESEPCDEIHQVPFKKCDSPILNSNLKKVENKNGKASTFTNERENDVKNKNEVESEKNCKETTNNICTQNSSSNTVDTLLPANQEAFSIISKTNSTNKTNVTSLTVSDVNKKGRKRACSQGDSKSNKRSRATEKSISDTETSTIKKFSKTSNDIQTVPEETNKKTLKRNRELTENKRINENETTEKSQTENEVKTSTEVGNGCLKDVSLFEEVSNVNENDSEINQKNDDINDKNEKVIENIKTKAVLEKDVNSTDYEREKRSDFNEKPGNGEVLDNSKEQHDNIEKDKDKNEKNNVVAVDTLSIPILLDSHSDSASESSDNKAANKHEQLRKKQKDNALAHVFGFSSGGAIRSHPRGRGNKKHTESKPKFHYSHVTTDTTSESESDCFSPSPRQYSRKRKYMEPKPYVIRSLEEEGGLFVRHGKKLYPLIKDDKIVKTFVSLSESDHDEDFWKLKYVEEKKRTSELTRLLKKTMQEHQVDRAQSNTQANIQQSPAPKIQPELPKPESTNPAEKVPIKTTDTNTPTEEQKRVKIKFVKKNEEVQIEGHWSYLNPVLEHVAQLFQKEPNKANSSTNTSVEAAEINRPSSTSVEMVVDSGKSTPIEDVVQNVSKRENEIAKEIERLYEEEIKSSEVAPQPETNITKRTTKQRKSSHERGPTPPKKAKLDDITNEVKVVETDKTGTGNVVTRRRSSRGRQRKSPSTALNPAGKPLKEKDMDAIGNEEKPAETTEQTKEIETEKTISVTTRRQSRISKSSLTGASDVTESSTVSTRRNPSRNSNQRAVDSPKTAALEAEDDDVRYKLPPQPKKTLKVTQNTNRRRAISLTNLKTHASYENMTSTSVVSLPQNNSEKTSSNKLKRKLGSSVSTSNTINQRTHFYMTDDITNESSNSFQTQPLKSMLFQNSTLSSDVYNSDSYRILMKQDSKKKRILANIEEIYSESNDHDKLNKGNRNVNADVYEENFIPQESHDNDNSSNISLPTSPALSIVENISISKSLLNNLEEGHLVDNAEGKGDTEQIMLNSFLTPNTIEPIPLMEQNCSIERSCHDGQEYHFKLNVDQSAVSESLLAKLNTVSIKEAIMSETLNVKLRNLRIESAKKQITDKQQFSVMEDEQLVGDKNKVKSRKRSSTPRKRQSTKKLTLKNTNADILEEHMEFCSHAGRKSCPPVITITHYDDDITNLHDSNESMEDANVTTRKGKKKKDVIKVKIGKPKAKNKCIKEDKPQNITDSGINDTEFHIMQIDEDSVELIHNHSDTCLNAHECMEDSVQIVENSASSVVSLNSPSSQFRSVSWHNTDNMSHEIFSNEDAQDGSDVGTDSGRLDSKAIISACQDIYSSPNSLITEDLSDEIPDRVTPKGKWYLFAEDTSDTNWKSDTGNASRLDQIFPVICSVPNLSTITEMSRENGDSRKPYDESCTKHDQNSIE